MVEGILKCRDTILSSIGGYEPALVQVSLNVDRNGFLESNYSQLVADERKNTSTEENLITGESNLGGKGLEASSRPVASFYTSTNQKKNSNINLDNQLLGKPKYCRNYRNVLLVPTMTSQIILAQLFH